MCQRTRARRWLHEPGREGTRTCERARAGAPSRASSLLPWRMAAHWSQWAPSPERGGAGFEVAVVATSVASEAQTASRLRHRWKWHRLRAHTYSLIRQTRAQTSPYPATIAGITGSCWGVVESKGSHMGFIIRLALKLSTPPRSLQAPTAHPFA